MRTASKGCRFSAACPAAITDPLAFWLLGARVVQSSLHLASLSERVVTLRFSAFAVQVGIAIYWSVRLIATWAGAS